MRRPQVVEVGDQPSADVSGYFLASLPGQERTQLVRELDLAAAPTAEAQVLFDRGAVLLGQGPVEVLPQLLDRVSAGDQRDTSLSNPTSSAYSHSCFSKSLRPRCSLASTVPNGASRIRATSFVAKPSTYTSTRGIR